MILTENAVAKIKDLLAEENNSNLKLRIFVQGGGCSGMQYGFAFEEAQNEDDFEYTFDSVNILVDSISMQYLSGSSVDYKEDIMDLVLA